MPNPNKSDKPDKPYPEFPLFAHNNGQWCRKVAGRLCYFGPWDDWRAAFETHNNEYPYLKAGVEVPDVFDGLTVKQLCNHFLVHKSAKLESGEISERWYSELQTLCAFLIEQLGARRVVETVGPQDFLQLRAKIVLPGRSPAVAGNKISRIRSVFAFGYEADLLKVPVKFGKGFAPPSKSNVRKFRNSKPKMLFSAADVWQLISSADVSMSAAVWLGINAGFNNSDCCEFRFSYFDSESRWCDYPRSKTGIERRFRLWPETIAAIDAYRSERPDPRSSEHSDHVLISSKLRKPWTPRTSVSHKFADLRDAAKVAGSYAYFRHTFETIAGGCKDQVAVRCIMGHVDQSISAEYRELVEDERLEAVTDHVRAWLGDQPQIVSEDA